jgi:glycoside/pentoside/hexuronide:cation symporter, GPH family
MSDRVDKTKSSHTSAYIGRVPQSTKLIYAAGTAAEAIIGSAFNFFNFFFYTNIMGVSGTLVGLGIGIALLFDAVSDPLIGAISDRWRSKLGRRHPFMFVAPVPVMICLFLIYSPPQSLESFGLFLWLTILSITMRTSITLFNVPHLALGAELSADFTERSRVMSVTSLFGAIGAFGFGYIAYTYFFVSSPEYANGMLDPSAYTSLAIFAAVSGGLMMLASTVFTMHLIPKLPTAPRDLPHFTILEFYRDCRSALDNRNFRVLVIGSLLLFATLGTRETIELHVNSYFWGLLPDQIRYFILAALIGPILGYLITAKLHDRFGKKPVMIAAVIGILFTAADATTLRILGFFPENSSGYFLPLLMINFVFQITFIVIWTISVMSAMADVADEHELTTHRRQEGMLFAARSFFKKASTAFGHLLGGIAIDLINFPVGAEPGTVDEDMLFKLGLMDGPVAIIPGAIAIFFYLQYQLNHKRHDEIQVELSKRRPPGEPAH